ncbi:hypothetical protein, partial [Paraclostridium bifermentans]|uniref:hypothetical protein n=1 Tax=Paraclostridium bifermentans TaxID=1490 RepID=UPI0034DF2258
VELCVDVIKRQFVEINTNLEFVFEEYKHRVHVDEENVNLDYISIEILKTLRYIQYRIYKRC